MYLTCDITHSGWAHSGHAEQYFRVTKTPSTSWEQTSAGLFPWVHALITRPNPEAVICRTHSLLFPSTLIYLLVILNKMCRVFFLNKCVLKLLENIVSFANTCCPIEPLCIWLEKQIPAAPCRPLEPGLLLHTAPSPWEPSDLRGQWSVCTRSSGH